MVGRSSFSLNLFLGREGLGASERDTPRRIWSNSSGERVIYLAEVTSGVENPGTSPMKLNDGEEEHLGEAARRKPSLGNLTSSNNSTSTSDNNAHLDPIAEDMMKTKEIKCEERSRVGGGSSCEGCDGRAGRDARKGTNLV